MIQNYFIKKSSKITYTPDSTLHELRNVELSYDMDEEYFSIEGLEFDGEDDEVKIYEKEFVQLIKFLKAVYLDLQQNFPKNFPSDVTR